MLCWLFGKRELTITHDGTYYSKVLDALDSAKIPYRTKWRSATSTGRSRGRMGSVGQNMNSDTEYYVYVLKSDYEKAVAAIR